MTAGPMERVTCKATSKQSGVRCRKSPEPGQEVCRNHGGASPNAKAAAQVRILQAKVAGELQRLGWEPLTDPVGHYADLAGEVMAFKELARAQVNELEQWELTIGSFTRTEEGEPPEFMAMAEQCRAVITVYERALDRAEKILQSMLKLNLDDRRIKLAEHQSRVIVALLEAVLGELDLSPAQQALAPSVIARRFQVEAER